MSIELFLFYVIGLITVASAVMVISARNPVHSVLFLILAFFNAAGLFVLIGAEFLAMVLVVVYVGAVAVLFMFVVMMLDINFVRLREGFLHYLPVGALIGVILLAELILVIGSSILNMQTADPEAGLDAPAPDVPTLDAPAGISNAEALGNILYTDYFYLFQVAGIILLVAIIGAITLTLRERPGVKRQDIGSQVNRRSTEAIELKDVRPGGGI